MSSTAAAPPRLPAAEATAARSSVRAHQQTGVRALGKIVFTVVLLGAVWAVSFNVRALPFFPTVLVGGGLAGALGWWLRRHARADQRPLPRLTVGPGDAALAVLVALVHFGIGMLLFAAGRALVPALGTSAVPIYDRTAELATGWQVVLAGVVTAPLEELFWRGAVHPALTDQLDVRAGVTNVPTRIAASALVYGLWHVTTGSLALVAAAVTGGFVWAWLTEHTRSVGAAMLAHGLWTGLMVAFPPV